MASSHTLVSNYPPGYLEEYNGNGPIAVAAVFTVLEVVCIALRFCARRIGKVAWGLDDSLIIPGAIACLAVIGCSLGDIRYGGVGYHQAAVTATSPSTLIIWAKYTLTVPMVYLPAVVLPKLAILVLYLRIFTERTDRTVCWAVAALIIANYLGFTIAGFCMCIPLQYLWNRTIPGGHCININAWYRWSSPVNIITDVVMLILPLPTVWKIQSSRNIKIGLTITFATGSIGLIASIIRFTEFSNEDAVADGTWAASKLIIMTISESGTYLIAACLLTYRPLAVLLWMKTPLSHLGSGSNKSGQSKGRHGTYEVPLKIRQKDGFTQLGKDRGNIVSLYNRADDGRAV